MCPPDADEVQLLISRCLSARMSGQSLSLHALVLTPQSHLGTLSPVAAYSIQRHAFHQRIVSYDTVTLCLNDRRDFHKQYQHASIPTRHIDLIFRCNISDGFRVLRRRVRQYFWCLCGRSTPNLKFHEVKTSHRPPSSHPTKPIDLNTLLDSRPELASSSSSTLRSHSHKLRAQITES